jgi:hypothetical protein
LAFHPYPQLIPQFCNTGEFGPRRTVTSASPWPWIAHVVSGRIVATCARFRLGFPLAALLWRRLTLQRRCTRRIILQKARHQPCSHTGEWPLTACEDAVSGTVSSPSRGAFHLSLTVLVHYRSLKVFSLGGWSPLLPTNSPGFVVLRMHPLPTGGSPTGLSPSLVVPSSTFGSAARSQLVGAPTTPAVRKRLVWAAPRSLATTWGISFDFSWSGY